MIAHVEGKSIMQVMTSFSSEAAANGASSVMLRTHAVINQKLGPLMQKAVQNGSFSGWAVKQEGTGIGAVYEFFKVF